MTDARLGALNAPLGAKLRRLALFEGIEPGTLDHLPGEFEWLALPGGATLFREGDQGDALYVLTLGRLGVTTVDREGREILIREVVPGETVGELALLGGERRSATVVALRDSELIRLNRAAFEDLVKRNPQVLRFIANLLAARLRAGEHRDPAGEAPRTLALVPLDPASPAAEFARSLAEALGRLGLKVCPLDHGAAGNGTEWFDTAEEQNDLVLYQADCDGSEWTRLCIRQADRIMLLARAATTPEPAPELESILGGKHRATLELAILHGASAPRASNTAELLSRYRAAFHYQVREGSSGDIARLARFITHRAVGIVLSGGGARGFAHIGVIKALEEAGVQLDLFGGASMGSIIAAGAAAREWDERDTRRRLRHSFVETNPLSDYTLPVVALMRGRKVTRLLRENFGDMAIEECWRPFFCVSTNLTTGEVRAHRSGPIWRAVRASVALPGVVMPVIEGSEILVDGGVLNNLPIDMMIAMRRGPVIAVDVGYESTFSAVSGGLALEERPLWHLLSAKRRGVPNIIELLMRVGSVGTEAQRKHMRSRVDLLIQPPLDSIGMLDWQALDRAVDEGYRYAVELLGKTDHPLLHG